MKNITLIIAIAVSTSAFSQVIIGDAVGTAPANNKTSVLLEFAANQNKGIILPYVRQKAATPTEGAIILDASTPTNARVKFYNNNPATTDNWTDLSGQGANVTTFLVQQPTIAQAPEAVSEKVIIGATSTSVNDGVLVLESNTKAMLLPIVSDVNLITSPSPGMMVYISNGFKKRLAVFNGAKWSFWRQAN